MARLLTTANDQSITLRCLCVCDSTLVGEHFHLLKMFEHESANFSRGMFLNRGEREREREREKEFETKKKTWFKKRYLDGTFKSRKNPSETGKGV